MQELDPQTGITECRDDLPDNVSPFVTAGERHCIAVGARESRIIV